jgi:hypothetical protein
MKNPKGIEKDLFIYIEDPPVKIEIKTVGPISIPRKILYASPFDRLLYNIEIITI